MPEPGAVKFLLVAECSLLLVPGFGIRAESSQYRATRQAVNPNHKMYSIKLF